MSYHKNIFAYLAGRLSGKQANRIEREAVDDPFLREAIEGLEAQNGTHEETLRKLRRELKAKTKTAVKPRYRYFQDAAILIIFISALSLLVPHLYERKGPAYYADLMKASTDEEIVIQLEEIQETPNETLMATPVAPQTGNIVQAVIDEAAAPEQLVFDVQVESLEVDVNSYIAMGMPAVEDPVEEIIPYVSVEQKPKFMIAGIDAGERGFLRWIAQHLQYPEAAQEQGLRGRVLCSFVITTEGKITDVKIISGVHPLLDNEALRVISSSPAWVPGMQHGHAVAVAYHIPVVFLLS